MRLAAPVTHPEHPDQDLLKRGYVVEDKVLSRLRDLDITAIYVDYPALDDLDRHLAPQLSAPRQLMYKQIRDTIQSTQKRSRPNVAYTDYYSATRDLITTLLSQGQNPIFLDQMSRLGTDIVGHSTAVAHLSLLLGIKLERYIIDQRKRLPAHQAKEVVNIGVAGMLHDLGKTRLPEELRQYNSVHLPDDPDAVKAFEEHARHSYEMIREGVEPTAAAAVLHHHQHFDGSGFPSLGKANEPKRTMQGEQIHIFTRILLVADLYDRLGNTGQGRSRRTNLEILHLMRTKYAAWTDPEVLAMLEVICPPFPPGSRLSLSDGSMAVVVDVDPAHPYHPIVKRLAEDQWTLLDEKISLKTATNLTIRQPGDQSPTPEPVGAAT